ncbi:bifunctional diguanylate cyclase/phosphodiesterase [Nitrincola tapanii]|uniref:EAL domain-containing protein n=1 Tax=Nitrincola tapanii TaxID=1708751 RepID=A0A5A9VYN3_9GAMM|nr:EAL domain-containing protein [Nitrincola tapanii]KAA0873586.1 EAL domain-containing protein [Nitrincola tapanii]
MDSVPSDLLLYQRFEQERLISRISSAIVRCNYEQLDEQIEMCLHWLAEFVDSDRSYLFMIRDEMIADNTHEWCAAGVSPQKMYLQNLHLGAEFPFAHQIRHHQVVNYPNIAALPECCAGERTLLTQQGIQSLIAVPMVSNKRLLGFIGIDAVLKPRQWNENVCHLLRLVGEMFTQALEHKRTETLLKASEARLRYVFETIPTIAVQGYDAERRVFLWNQASEVLYGYTREEALGRPLEDLIVPEQDREYVVEAITAWIEQGAEIPAAELTLQHKDGRLLNVFSSHVMHTSLVGEKELYCVDVDLTPLKQAQKELEKRAHFDALTGLPNRILLSDRLNQMISSSRRLEQLVAVAYLDLDGFKQINDLYGHTLGDRFLCELAKLMKHVLREEDTLARIGGDEFVAILGGLNSLIDCEPVLKRLLVAASTPIQLEGLNLRVSASIGVTLYPLDDVDPDQLLRHADQAMYQAKQAGKDRYQLFDIQLEAEIRQKQQSLREITQGLDASEFVLFYQPKINMQTCAFEGAEALIRWQHPERGLLSPAAFLPVTEGHQLELRLGAWVLRQALAQMQAWHDMGFDCPLSINISAQQIQHPEFAQALKTLLDTYPEVPKQMLQLEILETSALADIESVTPILQQCRALGVSLALDDFGTGYSSLAYLKRLPIDCLKIDQSFVRDMLQDSDDLSIIQGILSLARAFHLHVIAEGVETAAHGRQLLQLGCHLGQGYGIARPMPADQLSAWVHNDLPNLCLT